MLIVKKLITINPERGVPVSVLIPFANPHLNRTRAERDTSKSMELVRLPTVSEDMELYPLLNLFRRGHSAFSEECAESH